jgi:hypothetical protein
VEQSLHFDGLGTLLGQVRSGHPETGDDEMTAGWHGVAERGHGTGRVLVVTDVVQDRQEQEPDRLPEIDELPDNRMIHDLRRPAHVAGDDLGGAGISQQGLPVGVDVRDLVHVARRGQARANVEDLGDSRLGDQVPDRPSQEGPVGPRGGRCVGCYAQRKLDDLPVGCEIILSAEEGVINTGDVGRLGVYARWRILSLAAGTILSGHRGLHNVQKATPRRMGNLSAIAPGSASPLCIHAAR